MVLIAHWVVLYLSLNVIDIHSEVVYVSSMFARKLMKIE